MNIGDQLIILRDTYNYSQQEVADYLGISKSTYCRYERKESVPGYNEIQKLLELYNISYEELSGISFPMKHVITFPEPLLVRLEKAINQCDLTSDDYTKSVQTLQELKEALAPVKKISEDGFRFPELNLKGIPDGTEVKVVTIDVRGEKLIRQAMELILSLEESMFKIKYSQK